MDTSRVEAMINKSDLNLMSTKTQRAANLDKLNNLESIIMKEYSEAEVNLQRARLDHIMELNLSTIDEPPINEPENKPAAS
jgi:hypothetical protein